MKLRILAAMAALTLLFAFNAVQAQSGDRNQNTFSGTVEAIDHQNQTLTVAGQTFHLDSESLVVTEKGAEGDIENVVVGDYVALEYRQQSEPDRRVVTAIRK